MLGAVTWLELVELLYIACLNARIRPLTSDYAMNCADHIVCVAWSYRTRALALAQKENRSERFCRIADFEFFI